MFYMKSANYNHLINDIRKTRRQTSVKDNLLKRKCAIMQYVFPFILPTIFAKYDRDESIFARKNAVLL